MKRCLVLGANGFIGSHVCQALLDAGHYVIAFDISRDFAALKQLSSERLECWSGDFLNRTEVSTALKGAHWAFHLVSTTLPATSNKNMVFDVQSNVIASIELLEECVKNNVEKLVFASSGGTVYGNPAQTPVPENAPQQPLVSYGNTKLMIEKYCYLFAYQFNLKTVCLRLANPYGPGHHGMMQGAIPVFLKRTRDQQAITIWGDGSIIRDYVYAKDVARAFVKAADYAGPQQVFNIGSGTGMSLNDLIEKLKHITGKETPVIYEAARGFDVAEIVLDINLAAKELGWRPQTPLTEGIKLTWESLQP